jgi:hypothetical protein
LEYKPQDRIETVISLDAELLFGGFLTLARDGEGRLLRPDLEADEKKGRGMKNGVWQLADTPLTLSKPK